jgi:hypothetical protein
MSRPKCPNHTVEMDRSGDPRIWICPVSDARFEVDVDMVSQEKKIDKFGNPITTYKVTPLDGIGG